MADLTTTYLGLELQNPLIVGSSGITQTLKGIRQCAENGAAAVVLKSLFEEQIESQYEPVRQNMATPWHPEIYDYIDRLNLDYGPRDYLDLISSAKKAVDIPIIASINCYSNRFWIEFAKQIEAAGADAIELNMHIFPTKKETSTANIEALYIETLRQLKETISLPIALKLAPHFTNLQNFADTLDRLKVTALVLFNRFLPFDINIDTLESADGPQLSHPDEKHNTLRWIALLSGDLNCELAASTGNYTGADVIKQLLAGATVIQLCSTLYRNSIGYILTILKEIEIWMKNHNFENIDQFRGLLNRTNTDKPELYERFQFISRSLRYLSK